MSYANNLVEKLEISGRSFIYIKNSRGPNVEP